MNTAVKTLGYRATLTWSFPIVATKRYFLLLSLAIIVLISAFALVYLKDVNRRMISQLDSLQADQAQLRNQWTQFLLEKMQLSNQTRIIHLARDNLDMDMPVPKSVVMIHQE